MRFRRFLKIGAAGFICDAGLTLLLSQSGMQASLARGIALSLALLLTFIFNRYWTFCDRKAALLVSAVLYFTSQFFGALLNFLVYQLSLQSFPSLPVVSAIALGSAVSLIANYFLADRFAFSSSHWPRQFLAESCLIGFGAACCLWPVFYNGDAFIFFDSAHYIGLGKSIAARATALFSQAPVGAAVDLSVPQAALTYAGGRSVFYALPVFWLESHLGFMSVPVAQSFLAALTMRLAASSLSVRPIGFYLVGIIVCACLSPLAFYAGMMMPDVFAGIGILAFISLFLNHGQLGFWSKLCLCLILAFSAATHSSTLALCILLFSLLLGFSAWRDRERVGSLCRSIGLSLVVAVLALQAFDWVVRWKTGDAPRNPPYLAARLLADGPGHDFLARHCSTQVRFALCDYRDRQFVTQDDFLWSGDPNVGVFSIVDVDIRKAIKAEELVFALAVSADQPLQVLGHAVDHGVRQLFRFGVSAEFSQQRNSWDKMGFEALAPREARRFKAGLIYRDLWSLDGMDSIIDLTAGLALVMTLWGAYTLRGLARGSCLLVFAALALNAFICGAISGVNDRYQARVIWILPMMAIFVAEQRFSGRFSNRKN